jgi:NADH pyrophosphatase NudC (nudix superfamily)
MSQADFKFCPRCKTDLALGHHGGRERLACPACGFVHWRNPVPVVGAIVERAGRVVLVHGVGRPLHWYGLVAGFLETAETPAECAVREVKEELGIDATLGGLIGVYPFERMNQIIFVYHVLARDGEITLAADELDDYKQIRFEKIRPWPHGTGPGLRDWLVSRGYRPEIADFGTPQDDS